MVAALVRLKVREGKQTVSKWTQPKGYAYSGSRSLGDKEITGQGVRDVCEKVTVDLRPREECGPYTSGAGSSHERVPESLRWEVRLELAKGVHSLGQLECGVGQCSSSGTAKDYDDSR